MGPLAEQESPGNEYRSPMSGSLGMLDATIKSLAIPITQQHLALLNGIGEKPNLYLRRKSWISTRSEVSN